MKPQLVAPKCGSIHAEERSKHAIRHCTLDFTEATASEVYLTTGNALEIITIFRAISMRSNVSTKTLKRPLKRIYRTSVQKCAPDLFAQKTRIAS